MFIVTYKNYTEIKDSNQFTNKRKVDKNVLLVIDTGNSH